jgi:hypothetical protein
MNEIRIDRLEKRLHESAAEMRAGFCKNESRLDQIDLRLAQTVTKSDLTDLRIEMYRLNTELKVWMAATTLAMMVTVLVALVGLAGA